MAITKESIEKKVEKMKEKQDIKAYKSKQTVFLMTSRFNTKTREENKIFRERGWPNGCLYCSPTEVSQSIPPLAIMIVLEMDNDKNEIFAVGRCENRSFLNKYKLYEDQNYNRYNYIGRNRIKRENFNPTEEAVFKALDQLCFYGNEHMKRGNGIKSFTTKLLVNCKHVLDIPAFINNMFTSRFS